MYFKVIFIINIRTGGWKHKHTHILPVTEVSVDGPRRCVCVEDNENDDDDLGPCFISFLFAL